MRQVFEQVSQVARTNATVLISGESGTGKELIAHAIHYKSLRASKPFVGELRRAARHADRIGAVRLREGRVHRRPQRRKGPLRAGRRRHAVPRRNRRHQPADAGEAAARAAGARVRALGGTETIQVERPPHRRHEQVARDGDRRRHVPRGSLLPAERLHDLLPPLRERKADICCSPSTSSQKFAARARQADRRIATPAIDMLMRYHWPGNVRELENDARARRARLRGQVVHAHHLPPTLQTAETSGTMIGAAAARSRGGLREGT